MSISFNQIPAGLRVPLFYAEMDHSAANLFSQNQPSLLIGHKLAAGSMSAGVPTLATSLGRVWELAGRGSQLALMAERYLRNDPDGELWLLAVDEPSGAKAAGKLTFTGAVLAAGTLSLYLCGQLVQVAVGAGDALATIATNVAAAVNAAPDLPLTASAVAAEVTLTADWTGLSGNDIPLTVNYRGVAGGEQLPSGLKLAITAMAGGSGVPSLAAAVTGMGDSLFDFIALGFGDTGSLDALRAEMSDQGGRWGYARQLFGHVYAARRGSVSELVSFGGARNDQHCTVVGCEPGVQAASWELAAAYAARNASFLRIDPARPTQTGELGGILPAPRGGRFVMTERGVLLNYGIATTVTGDDGVMRVERAITTYQKNAWGAPDVSYLDSETLFTSAYVLRRLRQLITSKYGRHKLASDGTRFGPGQAIVTPAVIRAELISEYGKMEREGIVENSEAFAAHLIVERNANNPNRLDVLFPPDYVNQLRVFALLNQFRLQY